MRDLLVGMQSWLVGLLVGLGQSALLVSLPLLVIHTPVSARGWTLLIALGSIMFMPAAPLWGGWGDRHGYRRALLICLVGYAASYAVLAIGAQQQHAVLAWLILARVIYGPATAGLVTNIQAWTVAMAEPGRQVHALANVSMSLNVGRILGPVLAALLIPLHWTGPMWGAVAMAVLVFPMVWRLPEPPSASRSSETAHVPVSPQRLWLGAALGLACLMAIIPYLLPMHLQLGLTFTAEEASRWMGIVLTLVALGMLAAQLALKAHATPARLMKPGLALMLGGLPLIVFGPNIIVLIGGVLLLGAGAAWITPGYTAAYVGQGPRGKLSGQLQSMHTLGYGLAAVLVLPALPDALHWGWLAALGMFGLLALSILVGRQAASGQ